MGEKFLERVLVFAGLSISCVSMVWVGVGVGVCTRIHMSIPTFVKPVLCIVMVHSTHYNH